MTPLTKTTALALALLLAGTGALAQTKKELAAKLMQLQQPGIENVGRAIAGRTSQQILQLAGPSLQRLPADKREAAGRDVQTSVKQFYDEVEPLLRKRATDLAASTVSAAYEERFSEDELKQIIAWVESPTSRKFAQFDAEQGNALAEKVMADMRPTIEPKLKALEASIGKRLGVAPAPAAPAPAPAPKKQ
jgi:uncharacterized protein